MTDTSEAVVQASYRQVAGPGKAENLKAAREVANCSRKGACLFTSEACRWTAGCKVEEKPGVLRSAHVHTPSARSTIIYADLLPRRRPLACSVLVSKFGERNVHICICGAAHMHLKVALHAS
jgi:hypothetical protein